MYFYQLPIYPDVLVYCMLRNIDIIFVAFSFTDYKLISFKFPLVFSFDHLYQCHFMVSIYETYVFCIKTDAFTKLPLRFISRKIFKYNSSEILNGKRVESILIND